MFKFTIRFAIFILFLVIAGEIFFRTIIPASETPYAILEEEYNVVYFNSNLASDGQYTRGKFAEISAPWHVNNYGFVADVDYHPAADKVKPRIVVIGDSFIKGLMIPWDDHVANELQVLTNDQYDVYSIGTGASTLMQHTYVAEFAIDKFDPDILIFILNDYDVESSIYNYDKSTPFYYSLLYEDGEFSEVKYASYHISTIKRKIRKSAIVRYIQSNKSIALLAKGPVHKEYLFSTDSTKNAIVQSAANYLVQKLVSQHPEKKLIFVTDANRKAIYQDSIIPETLPESKYLRNACDEEGGYHLDLTEMFYNDYSNNRIKFDWGELDYHWNPRAHRLVSNSIYQYMLNNEIVSGDQN